MAHKMLKMRLEQQFDIIVACRTLHNFITLHKNGITISVRDPKIDESSNVPSYDNSNQIVIDKLRDEIVEILLLPTVWLFSYVIHLKTQT